MRLKQELEDSNVYFLNQLKREIDGEEQFSRLFGDQKQEGDQSSIISAFLNNPNTH